MSGPARSRRRGTIATVCATYLVLLVTAVCAAPLVAPDDPNAQDLGHILAGPGGTYWLGTDQLGRDVLSRLLYGGRTALSDVVIAVLTVLVVSVPLGVLAGYVGGWVDRVVMRVADLMFAVPAIVILLVVVAIFPGNDVAAMITLGVLHTPGLTRILRSATLACREELFFRAARLSGLGPIAIMRRHVLPNLAGPIVVQASMFAASALMIESGLSFLGLMRPDASGPSWGNLVAQAGNVSGQDPWLLLPTGGTVALTVIAFSLFGDAIRDAAVNRSTPAFVLRPVSRRGSRPVSDPPAATALLDVRHLSVSLRRGVTDVSDVPIVTDVSFTLDAGESLGILGESGCGKSSLVNSVLGLLPGACHIAGGSVLFGGEDLTRMSEKQLSRVRGAQIALVKQDALHSLDPTFTVASQLREVVRRHGALTRAQADERVLELLGLVRLPDPAQVARQRVHQLSGGIAQRVCIAFALAANPRILIADEPTSALDVTVQAEIIALLRELRGELGLALVVVTHDLDVLKSLCDRAIVMYAGEIVEVAGVEELHRAARHPYSHALIAADPRQVGRGQPLPCISGTVPEPGHWPAGCRFEPRCSRATAECSVPIVLEPRPGGAAARCVHTDLLIEDT
jgi:peptide/nickel transport system permease protein